MKQILTSFIFTILLSTFCSAQTIERIKFGDFNNWVTRVLTESSVIGGATKNVYEIGPSMTITGNKAYVNAGGSPWGTSNVYAKVCGVVKTSNAVYPAVRNGNDKCAKILEKAGADKKIVDIDGKTAKDWHDEYHESGSLRTQFNRGNSKKNQKRGKRW